MTSTAETGLPTSIASCVPLRGFVQDRVRSSSANQIRTTPALKSLPIVLTWARIRNWTSGRTKLCLVCHNAATSLSCSSGIESSMDAAGSITLGLDPRHRPLGNKSRTCSLRPFACAFHFVDAIAQHGLDKVLIDLLLLRCQEPHVLAGEYVVCYKPCYSLFRQFSLGRQLRRLGVQCHCSPQFQGRWEGF